MTLALSDPSALSAESLDDASGAGSSLSPKLDRLAEIVRGVAAQSAGMTAAAALAAGTANAQVDRLLEIADLSERASLASRQNRELVQATAQQVSAAVLTCEEGGRAINASVTELRSASQTVQRANELLAEVLRAAAEVRKMVASISGIAEQTNLLALNASIEAAHAGEKGAGFAVVAKEVRELAARSRTAASQISSLVQVMGDRTESAVSAVQLGAQKAHESVGHAEIVQQKLTALIGSMHVVKEQSNQVSEAAAGQIDTLARIGERGGEVQTACRDCAAAADGTAEASATVMSWTAQLRDLTLEMADCAGVAAPSLRLEEYDRQQAQRTPLRAKIENARRLFIQASERLGPATWGDETAVNGTTVPDLRFGATAQANAIALVDSIEKAHGCSATLFVCSGGQFVRIATSVRRGDGTRAVGTRLNARGLAAPQLLRGESYVGPVFIFGKPFLAAYDPILDSSGKLLGAWYVGHRLPEA